MLLSHAAPKKTGAKPPQRKRKDPQGPAEQPQARKDACSLSFGERDRCAVKWSMPLARALAAPVAAAARMRTTKTQPEPVDAPEAPKGANRAWHGFRTEEWSMAYARAAPPTAAAAPRGRTKKSKTTRGALQRKPTLVKFVSTPPLGDATRSSRGNGSTRCRIA